MKTTTTEILTNRQKNANKQAWYIEQADILDARSNDLSINSYRGISEKSRMDVNYDLFNNILNTSDFEYVCKPYGSEVGELPASMVNRDIVSGKIKAMLGMEMKRPFSWNIIATNPEATTRKEQEEFNQIKDYVVSQIMTPIRIQIEQEKAAQQKGEELTPEEKEKIQQEVEQELQARTPEEVKKYMARKHQDPAEVQHTHLLNYLIQECDVKRKFNISFKHGLLSAYDILFVGILNGEPKVLNINPRRFNCDKNGDTDFIEDREWATCRYPMTPSQIIKFFGKELSEDDINKIYASWSGGNYIGEDEEDLFAIDEYEKDYDNSSYIDVIHCTWKAPRKIGFLTYIDSETGAVQETMVDETYRKNTEAGDIELTWEYLPETYETWKIKTVEPIYVYKRPYPGQFKDLDNLYVSKLPYYGCIYDNMNSEPTSLMDRLKVYQYYFNIVMYRLELLLASDKGKKVLMNIGAIPVSSGIDIEKWQYFFEATPFMYYDPQEEGTSYADANTIAKVIDLSTASDIQKYIEIAEYLRTQAGRSVGITDQVEGQIGPNDAVSNTRQNLIQTSHILESYFDLHSVVKRNVLQALIEMAKIAYAESKPRKLTYFMDDETIAMFDLDPGLLDATTLSLFVTNSARAEEAKDTIRQLSQAALQNQKVEFSDVIAVLRQDSIAEAAETLKLAEDNRREYEQQLQNQKIKADAEAAEKEREFKREEHEMEMEKDTNKEVERRKTVLAQAALTGMSFNPDTDSDNDGVNDFFEIAKYGLEADIKRDKQKLEREEFEHTKNKDKEKLKLEKEKIEIQKSKNKTGNK